jgi:DNA polymerase-4
LLPRRCRRRRKPRTFGVRSVSASVTAKPKCPDLIFVKPRFDVYKAVSLQILSRRGLSRRHLSATQIAEEIRAKIPDETGLTASAGVPYSKFLTSLNNFSVRTHLTNGLIVGSVTLS